VLRALKAQGVRLLVLRSAGFNHVDLTAAAALGLAVGRVPAYSPHAVAEHTVALVMTLNRKIHKAYARVREGNFALDGLLGFDLVGRTVGLVGTGQIGSAFARIMAGFGCRLLAHAPEENPACLALGCATCRCQNSWPTATSSVCIARSPQPRGTSSTPPHWRR
jgi:D-lactate dehydrogenase